MSNIQLFDKTTVMLKSVLDLRVRNQQVISSNIANADTPGYTPAHLQFEEDIAQALASKGKDLSTTSAHQAHMAVGRGGLDEIKGRIIRTPGPSEIGDGNGVQVDREMIDLAENQILYEATTQMLNKKLGLLKYVIQDGR